MATTTQTVPTEPTAAPSPGAGSPFGVNEMRLSPRQWAVAAAILLASIWAVPWLWQRIEPYRPGPDDRIPYSLGEDYWLYQRRIERIDDPASVPVLGDSVVWGHYVPSDQSLSAHLNRQTGSSVFVNAGLDGVHPAALCGLIDHYAGRIANRNVVLHCNLLWMSSKRHDLQDKKARLNHPALVPQFAPRIPCYAESFGTRLGVVIGREVPLFGLVRHLQIAYFGNKDVPGWALEHPYENPFSAVTLVLPPSNELPSPPPSTEPWSKTGLQKFDAPWVDLETSIQWRFFQQTVEILQSRGNRVFVLVGPFNEHMLTDGSRARYGELVRQAGAWLSQRNVAHRVASLLPSDDYADASHPLAEGYAKLARQLREDPAFREFFAGNPALVRFDGQSR